MEARVLKDEAKLSLTDVKPSFYFASNKKFFTYTRALVVRVNDYIPA